MENKVFVYIIFKSDEVVPFTLVYSSQVDLFSKINTLVDISEVVSIHIDFNH